MSDTEVRLDFARPERVGFDEAILCARKSHDQLLTIIDALQEKGASALMTRLEVEVFDALHEQYTKHLDYDRVSRTAFFNWTAPQDTGLLPVAVVSAGTSDMP
ncbi:MAG: hypothetical protein AAF943_13605 [Pseudomonadota bacterium]